MSVIITGVRRGSEVSIRQAKFGNAIEWTEEYTVQTTDKTLSQATVIANAVTNVDTITFLPDGTLPVPQVTVSVDGYGVCKGISGRRLEENPLIWIFTSTWSSEVKEGNSSDVGAGTGSNDINAIVPVRKTSFEVVRRSRNRDLGGQWYMNGFGSLYSTALEAEEELPRWDFTQIDTVATTGGVLLTVPTVAGGKVRPPGRYTNSSYTTMIGATDDTIHYLNGAINSHTFRNQAPFTLKLQVNDSYTAFMYGKLVRFTDFTILCDRTRWFDKPVNAGPYFTAPALDASGNPTAGQYAAYEYIYYKKAVEDKDTNLTVDEHGPLGEWAEGVAYRSKTITADTNATNTFNLGFEPSIGSGNFAWTRPSVLADAKPLMGYTLVTGANGKKTYRAIPPDGTRTPCYFEMAANYPTDFNLYLRVR